MKKEIHPKFHPNATITCSCGNTFETGSTVEKITVEVCSHCHPFYTGKQKVIDTARRVEKFEERQKKQVQIRAQRTYFSKKTKQLAREKKKKATLKAAKVDAKAALKAVKVSLQQH